MRAFIFAIVLWGAISSSSQITASEFKLSYNSDWPPYSSGVGEKVTGILPKLLTEIIEKRMKVPVSNSGSAWKRAQLQVERGRLDGIVTVPTDKRLVYSRSSENSVYTLEMKAVVKYNGAASEQLTKFPEIDTFHKLRVCEILGNGFGENFYRQRKIKYVTASNVQACFRMMSKNRVDVIIQPVASAKASIAALKLGNSLKILPKDYTKMEFTLLLSKKSKFGSKFLKEFDATVTAMKNDGSYDKLVARLRDGE